MALQQSLEERRLALEQRISGIRRGKFDVEIINAVRDHPELYDKSHQNHKNPGIKELEWKRIAVTLKAPVGAVMKRWTVIRERFTAEKRKVIPLGPSSWWLMKHMNWLDSHIQPRQRSNSRHSNSVINYQPVRYIEVGGDEIDDQHSRSGSPPLSMAYPEVLMESRSPPPSSSNSMDGDFALSIKSFENDVKGRRDTNGSDDSRSGQENNSWLSQVLDPDEAAAARILSGLRTVGNPIMRHRLRMKVHHLCEELEVTGIHTFHQDGTISASIKEER